MMIAVSYPTLLSDSHPFIISHSFIIFVT